MLLAFTTITVLKAPYGDSSVASYEDRIGPVFKEAEQSPGFIARAKPVDRREDLTNFERDWGSWGRFDAPRFYTGGRLSTTDSRASTLSLWTGLESIWTFAHGGKHLYMLANQTEWTLPRDWHNYAGWWVADDHTPSWAEACEKLHLINDQGATPEAFDFRSPFGPDGQPHKVRKALGPPMDSGVTT